MNITHKAINSVPRKHRIGIDIDNLNQCRLLIKYLNAKRFGKPVLYKTGKGYHIQIVKMNRTTKENMVVRRILGDCDGRMALDEDRIKEGLDEITETMFFHKQVKEYIGEENIIRPLSKPYWKVRNR